jgi:hypothetical protein
MISALTVCFDVPIVVSPDERGPEIFGAFSSLERLLARTALKGEDQSLR